MKKSVVSSMTPNWEEPFGFTPACLYDVPVSCKHGIAYDVLQHPSGFADLCSFFLNSGHEASLCDPACRVGAYSDHLYHMFLVFFRCLSRQNQLQMMRFALNLELG